MEPAWIAPGEALMRFDAGAAQARAPDYLQSHLHRGSDLGGRGVEHSLRRHVRPHPVARACGEVVLGCEVSET
ncbi:MAG: hypothetical protein ACLTDR_00245 [Adlercreutzia equolifaciens]